jgi:hypothetical protein
MALMELSLKSQQYLTHQHIATTYTAESDSVLTIYTSTLSEGTSQWNEKLTKKYIQGPKSSLSFAS